MSKIEWTDETWNPVTGCTKISAGCANCYAERMAGRLQAMGQANYRNGFKVTCHEHVLETPFRWRKPRRVFVCSMSDLFHRDVPWPFVSMVFDVMDANPQHTYQVLSKRTASVAAYLSNRYCHQPAHIWVGTSIENKKAMNDRLGYISTLRGFTRFLSIEPLLEDLGTIPGLHRFDQVIVGGESGPGARPMHPDWVRSIRDQCLEQNVPFFFKQWGEWYPYHLVPNGEGGSYRWVILDGEAMSRIGKKRAGRLLDGREWNEFPKKGEREKGK